VVVSDATGATAGKLLDGLLAQFEDPGEIDLIRASKVTTVDQLHSLIKSTQTGSSTLVLATFVDPTLVGWAKSFCEEAGIRFIDVMSPLLDDFSSFFEDTALGLPGRANTARLDERKVSNLVSKEFLGMVEAVKWGQKHVSGLNPQGWGEADIVLIGRCLRSEVLETRDS